MAQVPNSFSYQMVIRNGNNELVANTTVGIRIGLLGGNAADTMWYEEEHTVKTNLNGLAYITIGKGNILKGAVSTIDWTKGPFFIKSETDPTGGTNYSLIIVSQMLSVPYAIYAKTAEKLSIPVTESDPLFNKSVAKGITAEDTARWSKKEVYDGNSGGGGITNESDPVFSNSVAKGIRSVDTAAWNNKLNLRDTMNLLRPYLRASDTASLSNRLNQKVDLHQLNTNTLTLDGKINIVDTSSILANYRTGINAKVNILDTLNMLIPYLRDADTTAMLANYQTGINAKVNILDTLNMLQPYLRDADTTMMLTPYLRDADTTSMLLPYLRWVDTTIMLSPYQRAADTTSMLLPYLRDADTTMMLEPYIREPDGPVPGDILNYNNNNKWARLPIGQEGQFLTVISGIPTWAVSTAPGPPTGVSATAGNSSASVAFVAPSSNGGTLITVYRVTSNPGGITATGTASPINITGLTNGLTYTFTVVATNAVGNSVLSAASTAVIPSFSCGTSTVSDIDGNNYNTVSLGTQCWMRDNLKSTRYRNGYPMPYVWGNSDWLALTTFAWCNYNNNSSSNDIYGKLYNWYAVVDAKGICPTGWHVPTDAEWTTLTTFLGGPSDAGGKMKTTGTTYWSTPNTSADNSSGFSGLGGGYRSSTDAGGAFYDFGNVAVFWSDSVYDSSRAYSRFLRYNDSRFDWGILSK